MRRKGYGVVKVFEPMGHGKAQYEGTITLEEGRVEVLTEGFRDGTHNPTEPTGFNFPAEICTIVWGKEQPENRRH